MGHVNAEQELQTKAAIIYSTIVNIVKDFAEKRKAIKKPVYGFHCSVAGDNEHGKKEKIYAILFTASPKFGFHRWKKDLTAIQLDTYNRLKKNGFKTKNGEVIFDNDI
jgi:hypothetical protein